MYNNFQDITEGQEVKNITSKIISEVRGGKVLSFMDGKYIFNQDNLPQFIHYMNMFEEINSAQRSSTIRDGIKKKREERGYLHRPDRKKRGNYRKTHNDEIVCQLREQGYTLDQIKNKVGISVGTIRKIIQVHIAK